MNIYFNRLFCSAVLAITLAACGGGGGGGGSPAPTAQIPVPTVSIQIDNASITLGASINLTWTSTNATSCTASGAWSGSQALNGTASQTPAVSGTNTYTISCIGGGGTATNVVTVTAVSPKLQSLVTVSSDIASNAYPAAYSSAATVATVNDECIITESAVQFLASDQGITPLPTIQSGASLKGIGTLSVSPMDFWVVQNATSNINNPVMDSVCGNTGMRNAFTATLLRAKALGATTLTMYDSRSVDSASNFQTLVRQFIPDADLVWMAQQAQANGMKIRYKIQIDAIDYWNPTTNTGGIDLNTYLATLTQQQVATWLNTMFTQYTLALKHMAGVMAQNPTAYDAIEIDWGYWNPTDWSPYNTARFAVLTQLSDDIRAIYPWKQWITTSTVQANPAMDQIWTGAQALIDKIDIIETMPIQTRMTTTQENSALTVSLIKSISGTYLPTWMHTVNKPFMWTLQVQSQNAYFSGTFYDGACPSTVNMQADFGAQAVGYEAFLEIIKDYSTTGINGVHLQLDSINSTGYAWTDTMLPYSTANVCARMQQGIRNKPAEAILFSWYK